MAVTLLQLLAYFKMEALIDALLDGETAPGITPHGSICGHLVRREDHKWWPQGSGPAAVKGIEIISAETRQVIADTMGGIVVDTYLTCLELKLTIETSCIEFGGHLCLVIEEGTARPLEFVYMTDRERAAHIRDSKDDFMMVHDLVKAVEWAKGLEVPTSTVLKIDSVHKWQLVVVFRAWAFEGMGEIASRPATAEEGATFRAYQDSSLVQSAVTFPVPQGPATVEGLITLLASFATFGGTPLFQEQEEEWHPLYTARGDVGTPWGDLIEMVESAADSLLITEGGRPNRSVMAQLSAAGFRVYAGETDSFGWLSGCIDIKVGEEMATLVYG